MIRSSFIFTTSGYGWGRSLGEGKHEREPFLSEPNVMLSIQYFNLRILHRPGRSGLVLHWRYYSGYTLVIWIIHVEIVDESIPTYQTWPKDCQNIAQNLFPRNKIGSCGVEVLNENIWLRAEGWSLLLMTLNIQKSQAKPYLQRITTK